jgi:hypothetical protein
MPDQPDQPGQPDPPEEWRVYQSDPTPDPEPEQSAPPVSPPPHVPYGGQQTFSTAGFTTTRTSAAPKLILIMIVVAVIGVGVAAAIAIFAAVDGGIGGLGGIDAKDPEDFQKMVDKLDDDKGTTQVQEVGFYTNYMIVYLPYTDDPSDDRQISYTWRGGSFEEWTKGTSDEPTFDLRDIDADAIDGLCDPVLKAGDGLGKDDCYVFLEKPSEGSQAWFRASASDDFGKSVYAEYDKDGKLLSLTCNSEPC